MLIQHRRGRALSDYELQAAIASRLSITGVVTQAATSNSDRAKALRYYRGEPMGNEVVGRSQVVSHDVQETVDGLMPSLIKVFASGPPVEFRARRQEHEQAAEHATEYVNHVWNVRNNGFLVYSTWFKDALLQRLGTVKVWWDATPSYVTHRLDMLTEEEFRHIQQLDDVEVVEAESFELGDLPGVKLYQATIKKQDQAGRVCVENIPPEAFLYDFYATTLDRARVVGDQSEYTASELMDRGYDPALIEQIPEGSISQFDLDRMARYDDRPIIPTSTSDSDPATAKKWVYELYMPLDYDGDGYAEMRRIVCAGPAANVVLENEEIDCHPYACLTPTIMPHRIEGRSIADDTMDLQDIKTATVRQSLDGMYLANNPMWEVVEGQVNIDDMLIARPGGIKRVKAPGMIRSLSAQFDATLPMGMIGYLDKVRELRTGLPQAPGELSDDVIAQDGGATGANIINDARMERVELIARTFADTGVRDAFRLIVKQVKTYQSGPDMMRMGGSWAQIDPSQWPDEFDMEIKVGLGSGKKDQMLLHLLPIKQTQEAILLQMGPENPIVGLEQYHNTLSDMVKNAGLGDPSRYWKNPTEAGPMPQKPPPPNPEIEKAKLEMAVVKAKSDQQLALEREKAKNDMALEQFKAQSQVQIEREKAIAQAAITANQELARGGMLGNAAADGIPPDDPQAMGKIEDLISQGLDGLTKELQSGMTADPMQGMADQGNGAAPPEAAGMAPAEPVAEEQGEPEDQVQTRVLTTMAETMRQQGEQQAAALQQVAEGMNAMAAALAKMGGPRKVRRGADGRIEGVE